MIQPILETPRLILRPFHDGDSDAVQRLAGERDIADTTLNIPHPYEDGMAEDWIRGHERAFKNEARATFAIVLRDLNELTGAIGLIPEWQFNKAEIGYWVGKPYWNQGYATEATSAMLEYGFERIRLNKIVARHLVRNPSSGRVMAKLGMSLEGTLAEDTVKWGKYEDMRLYGIIRDDWSIRNNA